MPDKDRPNHRNRLPNRMNTYEHFRSTPYCSVKLPDYDAEIMLNELLGHYAQISLYHFIVKRMGYLYACNGEGYVERWHYYHN